jgi:hypothetical protein
MISAKIMDASQDHDDSDIEIIKSVKNEKENDLH